MLLELRDLSVSLEGAGVLVSRIDDHLRPYPKQATFQVDLDAGGKVGSIRYLEPERVAQLRKYECSTGGLRESIPGFNIKPLFRPRAAEDQKAYQKKVSEFRKALEKGALQTPEQRQERLEALLTRSESNWPERAEAVEKCLQVAAQILMERLATHPCPQTEELEPICELLRRSKMLHAHQLREQLVTTAREAIAAARSEAPPKRLLELLFGKKAMTVVLELAEAQARKPASHQTVWAAINS